MEQKFVQVHRHPELSITACAVSKMIGADHLSELEEYKNYFVEPNQKWLENPADERAWVKVYRWINPKNNLGFYIDYIDSVTKTRIQNLNIIMPFLGENVDECWGEVQIKVKRSIVRFERKAYLEPIKFGRHKSFDTRRGEFGEWVEETKPIVPKKDLSTHGYIALRLYHQDYLPENQPDWKFEPVYVSIASQDFYRIDAEWRDEEIIVTATLLNGNSLAEVPKFLRT